MPGGFGGKGIRTPDLLIANETLYQLSYTPEIFRLPSFKVENLVCISTGVHPFCPPDAFFVQSTPVRNGNKTGVTAVWIRQNGKALEKQSRNLYETHRKYL
jgi:hypothetical protein